MGVPVLFSGEKRIVDSAANLWYNWQVVGEAVVLKNSNRCRCGLDKLKIKKALTNRSRCVYMGHVQ